MVEIYGYSVATIPIVAASVYAIIEFLKYFFFENNEKFKKFIPVFSAFLGGVITVVTFFVSPESVPCTAWYGALLMGCASGLSAVGINQIKKQAEKKEEKDADT
jgi:hypothetical protein